MIDRDRKREGERVREISRQINRDRESLYYDKPNLLISNYLAMLSFLLHTFLKAHNAGTNMSKLRKMHLKDEVFTVVAFLCLL